jgi:hypothetical protein
LHNDKHFIDVQILRQSLGHKRAPKEYGLSRYEIVAETEHVFPLTNIAAPFTLNTEQSNRIAGRFRMKNLLVPTRLGACLGSLALAFGLLSGCGSEPNAGAAGSAGSIGDGGSGNAGQAGAGGSAGAPVTCTPTVEIASNSRSFIVTDPEVLAKFGLERVLQQMITGAGDASTTLTPLELLQRLFDTENATAGGAFADVQHCDQFSLAFMNAPATHCPRAEGALATNPNLLTADDPNSFVPVAIVNRLDLTRQSGAACGEHRIVYAKLSGKTNPDDRVFLIVEASLPNPDFGNLMQCKPVADMWASLEKETNLQVVSDKLEKLFFTGLTGFGPVIHPDNCGEKSPDDGSYGGSLGQVRVGHKMQDPWEWREFFLKRTGTPTSPLAFVPVTVKNNPTPERFDVEATPNDDWFRQEFMSTSIMPLAASEIQRISMVPPGKSNLGQSAFDGAAASDYATRGSKLPGIDLASQIDAKLASLDLGSACPTDDPITGKRILQRASVQTCAGCHAPQKFLDEGNGIGCGLTWPDSLGEVHIDEAGKLSPALTDVFLPQRADVLSRFVGECSVDAIKAVLPPADPGDNALPK